MYCKHCGKELSEDAFMCPACGAPVGQTLKKKADAQNCERHGSALACVGFFLSLTAFITGVILGAFLLAYDADSVLALISGFITFLPGMAGIALGIYCLNKAKDNAFAKVLSTTGIVLAMLALVFAFIAICICFSVSIPSIY